MTTEQHDLELGERVECSLTPSAAASSTPTLVPVVAVQHITGGPSMYVLTTGHVVLAKESTDV